MLQLSDKELDQLSQKAAEQYDPGLEHHPGSWEKLDQQLTTDLGRTRPSLFRGYRRIPFLYAPIVVLLVGVSYFLFKQGARQNSSASKQSDTASLAGPANSSPPGAVIRAIPPAATQTPEDRSPKKDQSPKIEIPEKNSTTEKEISPNSPAVRREVHSPTGRPAGDPSLSGSGYPPSKGGSPAPKRSGIPDSTRSLTGNDLGGSYTSGSNKSNKKTIKGTTAGTNPDSRYRRPHRNITRPGARDKSLADNDQPAGIDQSGNNQSGNNQSGNNRSGKQQPDNQNSQNNASPNAGPDPAFSLITAIPLSRHTRPVTDDSALRVLASNIVAAKKMQSEAAKKQDRSLQIDNPLQIGLLYGPDFTTVKSVGGNKPGHSLGLTLDYRVYKGLSVHTGLLWTRKNYTAPAGDFHPPAGSWFNNNNTIQLHFVQGSMDMVEIPLDIRYDFKMQDNTLFYVSSGLSSYLVGNENCLYFYENFGMNRRSPEKQNDHDNYWFSALNLAIGIEKPISKAFSFQAEPYIKLPLNGMGIGNVQLNSFGFNFSVKYAPVLKRARH